MELTNIIQQTEEFVKSTLTSSEPGHDWWHASRVRNMAVYIAKKEGCEADLFAIQLAALLHDIADSKFHQGDEELGPQVASDFLSSLGVDELNISQVKFVIAHISFKGGGTSKIIGNKILDIVQDADRLDAMGAIGIARTFSYGGNKNRPMYDPAILPKLDMSKEQYKNSCDPTLNHFYEKLFKLEDLMNTETAKLLATQRNEVMKKFVDDFLNEWNFCE